MKDGVAGFIDEAFHEGGLARKVGSEHKGTSNLQINT
jgi:hypothetical protein